MTVSEKMALSEDKIFELENRPENKEHEIQDLANIASVITSSLDIESILASAMEISNRRVTGEVGAVFLLEDEKLTALVASVGSVHSLPTSYGL